MGRARSVATASTLDGHELRRWELGVGRVEAVVEVGGRLAVVVARDSLREAPRSGEVVLLDPASMGLDVLLSRDSVDISDRCWPLQPRPLETDSYLAQTLDDSSSLETYWESEPDDDGMSRAAPLASGMSDVRTELVGTWPDTRLQWTFAHTGFPGLVLRRRVPLFDELGRIDPHGHAAIALMEDLDTGDPRPASDARDGVLDV